MTPTSTLPATPMRPWLIALTLVISIAVVAAAWWAGQQAEGRIAAEQPPAASAGGRSAGAVALAASAVASAVPTTVARSASARPPPASTTASAPALTAELAPLPWPFWEYRLKQPLPPRSPPLVPPPWRMIGATQSAGGWSLVVLRQGRTAPEFFKVGESLPGGYRVAAISQDDVTLESGGRSVVLSFIGTR